MLDKILLPLGFYALFKNSFIILNSTILSWKLDEVSQSVLFFICFRQTCFTLIRRLVVPSQIPAVSVAKSLWARYVNGSTYHLRWWSLPPLGVCMSVLCVRMCV